MGVSVALEDLHNQDEGLNLANPSAHLRIRYRLVALSTRKCLEIYTKK